MFEPIEKAKKNFRVALSYDGDGFCGKFQRELDPDENADKELLRLRIYVKKSKWELLDGGNIVTYLWASDKTNLLETALDIVLDSLESNPDKITDKFYLAKFGYLHIAGKKVRFNLPLD